MFDRFESVCYCWLAAAAAASKFCGQFGRCVSASGTCLVSVVTVELCVCVANLRTATASSQMCK